MSNCFSENIGIHYHTPYHEKNNGSIFISANIGLWIDALSKHWREVFYFSYKTINPISNQDYKIKNLYSNIKFISCGKPGNIFSLPLREINTYMSVKRYSNNINAMIIRAPSPRQGTVYKAFKRNNIALYLVGEPPRLPFKIRYKENGIRGIIFEILNRRRQNQTLKLAKNLLLISNSKELCARYRELTAKEVFYCPTSNLSLSDFYYVEDRCNDEVLNLIYVGRISKEKGIIELLKAVSLMKARGRKVILNIVGEVGGEIKKENFKPLVKELEIEDMINWYGRVPYGEDLFNIYRKTDILVLPTRHEGFPRVIKEAMANGVLVMVARVGGIPAICEHRREVYFIDYSPQSIVNGIEELKNNSELRKKMIINGYSFAKEGLLEENARLMSDIIHTQIKIQKFYYDKSNKF